MRPDMIRGNVFVANLPHGLTDAQLAEAFDPYGIVLYAHLGRDPATGETLGHGLVQLAPDRAVEDAVARLNETGIAGQRIQARRADPSMGISLARQPRARAAIPRPFPHPAKQDHRGPSYLQSAPDTGSRRPTLSLKQRQPG